MVRPPGADRPLYTRIAASVKSRVLAGTYPPGARLPSEEELARTMGVSRSTMRQAIAHLRDAGYLTSRRGAGNFVAAELPIEPLAPQSGPVYSGFLDDLDNEANDVHEIQRTQRIITTNRRLAEDLRVPVGTKVVRYRATRLRHGAVYGVATDHIPLPVANRITPEILARSPTIVDALTHAGCQVAQSLQRLEPTLLDTATAKRCGTEPAAPALALTGIAYDHDRAPIDTYTLTIVKGYGIGLHLTRVNPAPRA
jgi:GntR family transcriptional regulator